MSLLRPGPLVLIAIAGALLAAAVGADGASPTATTASFTAQDYQWSVSGSSATSATIAVGGTVTLAYPTGSSAHDATFATAPTSCTGLPDQPTGPGWSATCTFATPGTYAFHCSLHPSMSASVVVVDPNAPPPTTTTTTTTSTTTTRTSTRTTTTSSNSTSTSTTASPSASVPTSPTAGTEASPGAEARAPSLLVSRRQHGTTVRGTLRLPTAGDVTVMLTIRQRGRTVQVARKVIRDLRAGDHGFAIRLGSTGRRALRRRGRLAVVVHVRGPNGPAPAARVILSRTG